MQEVHLQTHLAMAGAALLERHTRLAWRVCWSGLSKEGAGVMQLFLQYWSGA